MAYHKNGIKNVHWQSVLLLPLISLRKLLEGCLSCCKIRGLEMLACQKVECLSATTLETIWSIKTDYWVLVASLPDDWNCFWPITQWAPLPQVTTQQQDHYITVIPLWNRFQLSHYWHHPQNGISENNKFWYCPELCVSNSCARCPANRPHTLLNLVILRVAPCWQKQWKQPYMTMISL